MTKLRAASAIDLGFQGSHGLTKAQKLVLLSSLYFAQGLPFGFFSQALPVMMRQQAYALEWIGLSSLLALPWALKWIWAPLVDRVHWPRFGRRRSWILPLQAAAVISLVVLAAVGDESRLGTLLVGCFITNLLAATIDVATDGLAVEVLSPSERGLGNGIQVGGYRLGMIFGGGALVVVLDHFGLTFSLLMMALALLVVSVPVLLWRETERKRPCVSASRGVWSYVGRPGMLLWLFVLLAFKTGDALAGGMLRPFLVDRGLTMGDIGWLAGVVGSVTGLIGALLGGLLLNRIGRRRALLWFGLASSLSVAAYAWASTLPVGLAGFALLIGFEHITGGMATVALFAVMMGFCRSGSEGSDYTLQASVVVLSSGLAHSLSGFSAGALGYTLHFGCAATLAALCATAAWWKLPATEAAWAREVNV